MQKPVQSNSYDTVPYGMPCYRETHPRLLCSAAEIYGFPAPAPDSVKILELGCASGGNLIPIAAMLPKTECLGIDLSAGQVATGSKLIAELGLKNVRLEARDLATITEKFGQFDLIVCHGVYSWVPEPLQRKIMEIFRDNLKPNGLAYLSFNTGPGWSVRSIVRQMMCFGSRGETAPEKVLQSGVDWLKLYGAATATDTGPFAALMRKEIGLLQGKEAAYILHEYLEESNNPAYFTDVVASARSVGLHYVADARANYVTEFDIPAQLKESFVAACRTREDQEQLLDFVRCRSFRRAIFSKGNGKPGKLTDRLPQFSLAVYPESTKATTESFELTLRGGAVLRIKDAKLRAVLERLAAAAPVPVPYSEIGALSGMGGKVGPEIAARLADYYAMGLIEISKLPALFTLTPGDRPQVWKLARVMAKRGVFVPNLRLERVQLDGLDTYLVEKFDGTRTVAAASKELAQAIAAGSLKIKGGEGELTPTAVPQTIQTRVSELARKALFSRGA